MSDRVAIGPCQRRLFVVWAAFGVVGVIMVLVQTAPGGAYQANGAGVWDWFLPNVTPTFSLMLGTLLADAHAEPTPAPATVSRFVFRLAVWSSVLYLLVVLGLLLAFPQQKHPVDALRGTSKAVAALYGVVSLVLGVFFVSKTTAHSAKSGAASET